MNKLVCEESLATDFSKRDRICIEGRICCCVDKHTCSLYLSYFYFSCHKTLTLKNVLKTYDAEAARRMKARKVLRPPYRTAAPMNDSVFCMRSDDTPQWHYYITCVSHKYVQARIKTAFLNRFLHYTIRHIMVLVDLTLRARCTAHNNEVVRTVSFCC